MIKIDWIRLLRNYVIFGYYLEMYITGQIVMTDGKITEGKIATDRKYHIKKFPTHKEIIPPWHKCWKRYD